MANSYEILLNIGGKLASSLPQSTASATKAISGIQKAALNTSKTMSLLKGAFEAVAGAAAIKTIVDFGKDCMDAAGKGEEATTQLQSVLKSTGGAAGVTQVAADNLAKSLSSVTTFSKDTVLSSEDLLLTFTKIGKDVMPSATETVLNMSQALGQDTKSSALQLGKALNDPINGMTALKRVGVTFSDAQKKQITQLEKSGNLMGAQKVILAELNTEFGNSAKAMAQTPTGRVKQLNNAWEEVKENIGEKLIPVVTSALNLMGQKLPEIEDGVEGIVEFISPAFGLLRNTVIPGLGIAFNAVIPVASKGFDYLKNTAIPDLNKEITRLTPTLLKTGDAIKNVFDFAIQHKQEVIATVVGIGSAIAAMKIIEGVTAVTKSINTTITTINSVRKAVTLLRADGTGGLSILKMLFGLNPMDLGLMVGVAALAAGAYIVIKNWGPISTFFKNLWSGIKTGAINDFNEMWNGIKPFINLLISGINFIIKGLDSIKIPKINLPGIGSIGGVGINIPEIPKLANGGRVKHRSGGILANIGEGKYDEAVVPLKNGNGIGGGMNINYAPVYNLPEGTSKQDIKDASSDAQREFAKQMAIWEKNKNRVKFA